MAVLRAMRFSAAVVVAVVLCGCPQATNDGVDSTATRVDAEASSQAKRKNRFVEWWNDPGFQTELELSEEQVREIADLIQSSRAAAADNRKRERQLNLRFLRALSLKPYDPELVQEASDRLVNALSDEHRRRVERVRRLREILTAEQWIRLWEMHPDALTVGRFKISRGPKVAVGADQGGAAEPTP